MQELAEQLSAAPATRPTFQAVCALLQSPLWEDPEYSWCARPLVSVDTSSAAVQYCVLPERDPISLISPSRGAACRIATSIFDVILGWGKSERKAFVEVLAGYPKDRLQVCLPGPATAPSRPYEPS